MYVCMYVCLSSLTSMVCVCVCGDDKDVCVPNCCVYPEDDSTLSANYLTYMYVHK